MYTENQQKTSAPMTSVSDLLRLV